MGKRKRPGKQERLAAREDAVVLKLEQELQQATDPARILELQNLLARLNLTVSEAGKPKVRPSKVPVPRSYLEAREAKIKAAHDASAFSKITATFVQAGAPGSGRKA